MAQGVKSLDVEYITRNGEPKDRYGKNVFPKDFIEWAHKYTPHELSDKLDIDLETPRRWEKASGIYMARVCKKCGFRKDHASFAKLEPNPVCQPCYENPPRTSEEMMRHFSQFTFPIPKRAHV